MPPCRRLTLKPTGGETGEVCETRDQSGFTPRRSLRRLSLVSARAASVFGSASGLDSVRSLREMRSCTAHWSPQLTARTLGELWRYTHSLNSVYEVRVADPVSGVR